LKTSIERVGFNWCSLPACLSDWLDIIDKPNLVLRNGFQQAQHSLAFESLICAPLATTTLKINASFVARRDAVNSYRRS